MEHAARGRKERRTGPGHGEGGARHARGAYARFAVATIASLAVMYAFMFSELATPAHFHFSVGMFWMAVSMLAGMTIVMLLATSHMLPSRRANVAVLAASVVVLVLSFAANRVEFLMGDDAFVRAMIPHHSSAVHMCREATLTDPEIVGLCRGIVESQSREIAQMEAIIARRG